MRSCWFIACVFIACVFIAAVGVGGCASSGSGRLAHDARQLRDLDPAPYRVAIARAEVSDRLASRMGGGNGSLPLALSANSISKALARDLRRLDAATEIVELEEGDDLALADAARADLLLRPRVTDFDLGYDGVTDNAWLSGLLWITTWIGGLVIADTDYDARLRIEWDVVNPHTERRVATVSSMSDATSLAFLDRHDFISWGTLSSVIVPPFLTGDDVEATSETLSHYALGQVAARCTAFLKSGLDGDERELLGRCRIESPRNGERVAETVSLRGAIVARDLVTEVAVFVNDDPEPRVWLDSNRLPSRAQQQIGSLFEVPLSDVRLRLGSGENHVAIEFVVAGRRSSRTIRLVRPATETGDSSDEA